MKALVIDDERVYHTIMERLLSQIDGVELVGCYLQPEDALDRLRRQAADIAFIDIQIGQENGLDVARLLRSSHPDLEIVFVTSHKEYAAESFESYPLDYIVKPVSKRRLEQTIARAASRLRERKNARLVSPSPASSVQLKVRALGGLEVGSELGGPVRWISKKSLELFAFLLMHRGRGVSKSRILEHVFPDMPQKNAETYLNTSVYQLRKALQEHGYKHIVDHAQEQYWLLLDRVEVDFMTFEAQVTQFGAFGNDAIEDALACERLYSGELYEDQAFVWSVAERTRLHDAYVYFAKQLSRWLLAHRRPEQAAMIVKKIVQRNELEEESNLLLLQAYGELKDIASLARQYERISQLYQQELTVPLPAEFTATYERYSALP